MSAQAEFWLRGPIEKVPPLLQPVAHALFQAKHEVTTAMKDFPDEKLWLKPAGLASAGFHLQHLSGVLDRLFTYAADRQLDQEQLEALAREGSPYEGNTGTAQLLELFSARVEVCISRLRETDQSSLTEVRRVGRAGIPSTVLGLLFHAAEHTMRHTGQLLVTARIVAS